MTKALGHELTNKERKKLQRAADVQRNDAMERGDYLRDRAKDERAERGT
jgi:hypothetical protein